MYASRLPEGSGCKAESHPAKGLTSSNSNFRRDALHTIEWEIRDAHPAQEAWASVIVASKVLIGEWGTGWMDEGWKVVEEEYGEGTLNVSQTRFSVVKGRYRQMLSPHLEQHVPGNGASLELLAAANSCNPPEDVHKVHLRRRRSTAWFDLTSAIPSLEPSLLVVCLTVILGFVQDSW